MPHYRRAVLRRSTLNVIKFPGRARRWQRRGHRTLAGLPRTGWRPRVTRRQRPRSAFNASQSGAARRVPRHQPRANWALVGDSAASRIKQTRSWRFCRWTPSPHHRASGSDETPSLITAARGCYLCCLAVIDPLFLFFFFSTRIYVFNQKRERAMPVCLKTM